MSDSYEDIDGLRSRLQRADEGLNEAIDRLSQTQIESTKERTQYFEKLSIGGGAAIAAVVSFLGTHKEKLQPTWVLRCSLIALVIVVLAALYRNFRYPSYLLAAMNRLWIQACRSQQQCRHELFHADPSLFSGEPVDMEKWAVDFTKSDGGLATLVEVRTKRENRIFMECKVAEYFCLAALCLAMISLVWLGLRNF